MCIIEYEQTEKETSYVYFSFKIIIFDRNPISIPDKSSELLMIRRWSAQCDKAHLSKNPEIISYIMVKQNPFLLIPGTSKGMSILFQTLS